MEALSSAMLAHYPLLLGAALTLPFFAGLLLAARALPQKSNRFRRSTSISD